MNPHDAVSVARTALGFVAADEAEVVLSAEDSALTRFASNRIGQNVAERNASARIRAVLGQRTGVAVTNRYDDASLRRTAAAAVEAAVSAVPDDAFPGLPSPVHALGHDQAAESERSFAATREYGAEARAEAVARIVHESKALGMTAAGTVKRSDHVLAVANSKGISVSATLTGVASTVLSSGDTGNSGWASFVGLDVAEFDPRVLGAEAASLAKRTRNPGDLEPGTYPVVLGPEAVSDVVDFLGWTGFGAKAISEGRSFMSGRIGERVMSESVTILDDACAAHAIGFPFDFEGIPKQRLTLVDRGVPVGPVTDSYWASKTGRPNTGHALPAPNPYGPLPANLELTAGQATIEQLIGDVRHGVYVTRFHYVNVEDPISVTLTGMTRDGTFLIEDGKLTRPLKNLRFTQSAVDALASCRGITRDRRFVGTEEGATLVPGVLLAAFAFTGQTT